MIKRIYQKLKRNQYPPRNGPVFTMFMAILALLVIYNDNKELDYYYSTGNYGMIIANEALIVAMVGIIVGAFYYLLFPERMPSLDSSLKIMLILTFTPAIIFILYKIAIYQLYI
jgi:hypothetical protein